MWEFLTHGGLLLSGLVITGLALVLYGAYRDLKEKK